ncbi:unnamed protein product, partial [Phaeothamnion confervicola]
MVDTPPVVRDLQRLRNEASARLKSNPDYLAIQEIDRSIAAVMKQLEASGTVTASVAAPSTPAATRQQLSGRRPSQGDASLTAIEAVGTPVAIEELVDRVESMGVKLTGRKLVNLSSSLSRDPRFVSISWRGGRKWWLAGKELPSSGGSL